MEWRKKHPEFAEVMSKIKFGLKKGRTEYDPDFCRKVREWGKEGKSRKFVRDTIDVSYTTLVEWETKYPEFAEAMKCVYSAISSQKLFDFSFCEKVIEWGKEGKSKTWMAAELGITKTTVDVWLKQYPEFYDAMQLALLYSQKWWEDEGQKGMFKPSSEFNSTLWSKNMAARFHEDWREKHEITGANGAPLMPEGSTSRDIAIAIFEVLRSAKTIEVSKTQINGQAIPTTQAITQEIQATVVSVD